jgi:hypothetical protein
MDKMVDIEIESAVLRHRVRSRIISSVQPTSTVIIKMMDAGNPLTGHHDLGLIAHKA